MVEAKRFEGVYLCRNVCLIQKSNCVVCKTLSFSETIIIVDDKTDVLLKVVRDPCQKITLLLLKSKSVRVIVPESCF